VVDFGFFGGVNGKSDEKAIAETIHSLSPEVLGFKCYFVSGMESFTRCPKGSSPWRWRHAHKPEGPSFFMPKIPESSPKPRPVWPGNDRRRPEGGKPSFRGSGRPRGFITWAGPRRGMS
jgi:hypothetical protein